MHWENLPKVTHNEDAVREYEQMESRRIGKFLKKLAFLVLPVILLLIWLLQR